MKKQAPPSIKRTQRDYTLGFKLAVIDQVERGDMTYKQAQAFYGIQGRSTVLVWLRKHGNLDWSSPRRLPVNAKKETPAQTIKRLQKELKNEKERALLFKTMVDVYRDDFGITMTKKRLSEVLNNSELKKK